jgi:hypothetical protein
MHDSAAAVTKERKAKKTTFPADLLMRGSSRLSTRSPLFSISSAMGTTAEVASTVGTWVAAAIAIVALFGILPTWLLWRNVRSTRHLALKELDDPRHKFISKGFHVWRNVYAFKRVKVPYLLEAPRLTGHLRKDASIPMNPSRTGWIAFLESMQGFTVPVSKGGDLVFDGSETLLPVQKLWILVFGLLGRYSQRRDRGQAIVQEDLRTTRLDHENLHGPREDPLLIEEGVLCGDNGILSPNESTERYIIHLHSYNEQLRGDFRDDKIPLSTLFWLFAGCLPSTKSRVFDLCHDEEATQYQSVGPQIRTEPTEEIIPWAYELPARDRSDNETDSRYQVPIILYRYRRISHVVTSSQWYAWASAMGCYMQDVMILGQVEHHLLSVEELNAIPKTINRQTDASGYNNFPWMRINSHTCIWRSDVHALLLGILSIPTSSRHFLFANARASHVDWILATVGSVQSGAQERASLFNAIKRTFPRWPMFQESTRSTRFQYLIDALAGLPIRHFSRRLSHSLALLDDFISEPEQTWSWQVIGILYLSSSDFRKFVYVLAVKDASFASSSVVIDSTANTVRVTLGESGSSTRKETVYRMHMEEVFGRDGIIDTEATISLSLQQLMLACLQAWTRMTWYSLPLDSDPLIHFVNGLDEVVYISARTQPPVQHRHPARMPPISVVSAFPPHAPGPDSSPPQDYPPRPPIPVAYHPPHSPPLRAYSSPHPPAPGDYSPHFRPIPLAAADIQSTRLTGHQSTRLVDIPEEHLEG